MSSSYYKSRLKLRRAGIFLLIFGFGLAAVWHFYLLPLAQRFDPVCRDKLSPKFLWKEEQKNIRRFGWEHDDFVCVGYYGDKYWAEWIMNRIENGEPVSFSCREGHKDQALRFITCQDPAPEKNMKVKEITNDKWLAWWAQNKTKRQAEWIQEGLRQYGLNLNVPSKPEEWGILLEFLGKTEEKGDDGIPSFVAYNAFRWLRDSGFDPIAHALAIGKDSPELLQAGLFKYARFAEAYPSRDGIGILSFDDMPKHDCSGVPRPRFFDFSIQALGYFLMAFSALLGSMLLWITRARLDPAKLAATRKKASGRPSF